MCDVCGIASENYKFESPFWNKMCEYITKNAAVSDKFFIASSRHKNFIKTVVNNKCIALLSGYISNGEALRRKLYLRGVAFDSECDAELVLNYYILFGENALKMFKGEFSIVIWDGADKSLLLACDKVGFKSLFYYFDGSRLIFASSVKELFKFPFVKKELCDDIYCKLFAFSNNRAYGETIYNKIYEIPPGCFVRYRESKVEVKRYHMFSVKDASDGLEQTLSGVGYLCRNKPAIHTMREYSMEKEEIKAGIEHFVELSDFPSPFIDLKVLSNLESDERFTETTNIFSVPAKFELSSGWCKKQSKESANDFLSDLPWFEYKDVGDIAHKEEVYIKQYIVLPQIIYAKRRACKNIVFPYLEEEVAEYLLQSLKYGKKISKKLYCMQSKCNRNNYRNLKALFYETLQDKNLMSGIIEKEELLKFTRLFPRPETMLYLLQVNVWLNMFL